MPRSGRPVPQAELGRDQHGPRDAPRSAVREQGHRGTGRGRRTVRPTLRRRSGGHRGDASRPGRAAVGLRRGRAGSGLPRGGSATAAQAHQSGRALSRHGTVLRRQQLRAGGRGDDDVHRIDSGQSGRRAAGRLGGAGAAGTRAGADDDRDRRQLANAGRRVHRLGLQPAAGVGPDGLGALRAHTGCQRRRPRDRLGAVCAQGPGDDGAQPGRRRGGHPLGPLPTGWTAGCCSAIDGRPSPTWNIT